MRNSVHFLAVDIGASSGRGVVGTLDGETLKLCEVYRFANHGVKMGDSLRWDAKALFEGVKTCIRRAYEFEFEIASVAIDTWGVDYGLLDIDGKLLTQPFHYRDERTKEMMAQADRMIGREKIYARTGIAFLPFNTLYQLMAEVKAGGLSAAHELLFMPDLLNYWLTGVRQTEETIASTSQMYEPNTSAWAFDLLEMAGIPRRILPRIAKSGTIVGKLLPEAARETGAANLSVIAPASHDTGSAVAGVPGEGSEWAYISSGTWSLVGRELKSPICSESAREANFTNEVGLAGTIRFQKNVTGLWILQVCQRVWEVDGKKYTIEHLNEITDAAPALQSLIDPDAPAFAGYGIMPRIIQEFCERTGQPPPRSDGQISRCILESLALKCAAVVEELERLTGKVGTLHMVGGGVMNTALCQFTANATGKAVVAGPVEATAIGNIMAQALALGKLRTLDEIRRTIRHSFNPVRYEPLDQDSWVDARGRLAQIMHMR